jgi:hypothetical protein
MGTPTLTVCIPIYNGERYIAEAIQSVLAQSFADLEIIVVDDQSTDSTAEIVRSIRDPRIVVYENEQRLGIPGNWNQALSLARGEYVCLFHQDDRMEPDNLARKVRILDSDPTIGLIHSAIKILVEPSAPYPPARWVEDSAEDFIIDGPTYFRRLLLEGNLICAPTVLARRSDLLGAGGFDPELGFSCDYALWMKLCLDRRVAFLSQPLVQYRWHADNETHRYRFEKGVQETWVASRKVLSYYRQRPGREQEAELLQASVDALARVRRWAADLEKGKEWLEGQVRNWQVEAEGREQTIAELRDGVQRLQTAKEWFDGQVQNWQAEVERREQTIAELKVWNTQLETAKEWLEGQSRNWQETVGRHEQTIAELQGWNAQLQTAKEWLEEQSRNWQETVGRHEQTIAELQGWNAQLQTAKEWLEEQSRNWQAEAERREEVISKLKSMLDQHREAVEGLHQRAAELEEDRLSLEVALRSLEERTWTRIGRWLRLMPPPSPQVQDAVKGSDSADA